MARFSGQAISIKVYLYENWKFKLTEKFVCNKMYMQSHPSSYPAVKSVLLAP